MFTSSFFSYAGASCLGNAGTMGAYSSATTTCDSSTFGIAIFGISSTLSYAIGVLTILGRDFNSDGNYELFSDFYS